MRAFVITGPREGSVQEVAPPVPGFGQVVIAVDRVGVCGTDAEFFRGTQPYLATGGAKHPLRIGHEWCGRVARVGEGVDAGWVGRRVTGDTMLGCQKCELCRTGRQHVCEQRSEVGVLNGWHGALADELLMPVSAIHELPDSMSDGLGALVEPASLSLRCVETLGLEPGDRLLVWGAGAVGLLAVAFAAAAGISVHVVGRSAGSLDLALHLGAEAAFRSEADGRLIHYVPPAAGAAGPAGNSVPRQEASSASRYRGAIAASPDAAAPRHCLDRLEPGGHLVLVGISGDPSPLESRDLIVQDVTVSALLSGSPVFARTIEVLASGAVEAEALVGAVIGLEDVASALAGTLERGGSASGGEAGGSEGSARNSAGPKVQIDLHRR